MFIKTSLITKSQIMFQQYRNVGLSRYIKRNNVMILRVMIIKMIIRCPTLITVASTPAPFHDKPQPVKLSDVTEGEFFTPLQITETMGRVCHIMKL